MAMPMGDYFYPDINFTTPRSVYPTAQGGTIASAGGAINANTGVIPSGASTPTVGTPLTTSGKSLGWWIGFVAFLLVMVWAARKAGGEEDFRNIRPTFYNFLTITLTSIVGIVGFKVIASKWRVPGASDIILAA